MPTEHHSDVERWRQRARVRLPRTIFDYLDGGAESEIALGDNRTALDRLSILPRVLRDVSQPAPSTELLGFCASMPVAIAPTGFNGLLWPDGDVALANAAVQAGIPFTLSTASNASAKRIAERCGTPPWFQLYVTERTLADRLIEQADAAGCAVLMLTVDVPVGGMRLRDQRNGFGLPLTWTPRLFADLIRHPRWSWSMRTGVPAFENLDLALGVADPERQAGLLARNMDASFSWEDLAKLRRRWPRKLVVKGILHPEDARRALELGADGIVVSNHGGRQLDGAPATASILPEIVDAVSGKMTVLVDGGVRRGEDVLKMLVLGADGVLLGRATLYGLAAAGQDGVAAVLDSLRKDVLRGMTLCGTPTIGDVRTLAVYPRHH